MQTEAYQRHYELEETHWWFVSRRYLLLKFITKLGIPKTAKIFDFGCGTGATLKYLSQFGNAKGGDISKKAISYCKKRGLNAFLIKEKRTPFASNSFDLVTALDVIEHIKDDGPALRELHRILKKGGVAVFTVPAFQFLWGRNDEILGHVRRYAKDDFEAKVQKAGFKIVKSTHVFMPYVLPLFILHRLEWFRSRPKLPLTLTKTSPLFNMLCKLYVKVEAFLLDYFNLPFGTSIFLVCTK